jgi:hypothetical protein
MSKIRFALGLNSRGEDLLRFAIRKLQEEKVSAIDFSQTELHLVAQNPLRSKAARARRSVWQAVSQGRQFVMIMSPEHPRWDQLTEALAGPEFCDFKEVHGQTKWSCFNNDPFPNSCYRAST